MSDETELARPKGVQATVIDSGQIVLEFDHEQIPQIELSKKGAAQVGSYLHSAVDRLGDNWEGDDE